MKFWSNFGLEGKTILALQWNVGLDMQCIVPRVCHVLPILYVHIATSVSALMLYSDAKWVNVSTCEYAH